MTDERSGGLRTGVLFGLTAYGIWGLVPLFWVLVERASATEILAHRMIWSLIFALLLSVFLLRRGWLRRLATRRKLIMLAAASAVISVNWGVFIWATTHGHVTEVALGYYINPIVSILFGVLLLRERLHRWQWAAVAVAAVAVVVLTVEYGRPPWIALTLAGCFGLYGLLKNRIKGGALDTLVVESAFMAPPALAYLIFLQITGSLTFIQLGLTHSLFLAAGGLVTLVPLLAFSAAATRIPLSMIGLLQYVAPTLHFLLGLLYFGEQMSTGRWIGFGLVWVALMILTTGMFVQLGRSRRPDASDLDVMQTQ